jgi:hypothetical protein
MNTQIKSALLAAFLLAAPLCSGAGLVLTKKTPDESPKYWTPIEFMTIEQFPTSVVISSTRGGAGTAIPRHQIAEVIEFVNFSATTIVNAEQLGKIKADKEALLARAATLSSQAAGLLTRAIAAYEQVISTCENGNVLLSGKWMKVADFEEQQRSATTAAKMGSVDKLEVGSMTYKGVRVKKVIGNKISIMHDDGVSTIVQEELSEAVLLKLKSAFPKLFAVEDPTNIPPPVSSTKPASTMASGSSTQQTSTLDKRQDLADEQRQIELSKHANSLRKKVEFLALYSQFEMLNSASNPKTSRGKQD